MRKFFYYLLLLLAIPVAYVGVVTYLHADLTRLPALQSGDLIFETSLDRSLTAPIMFATGSIYTHVGIVHKQPDGSYTVVHAAGPVIESTLAEFVHDGWGERFTVLRYPDLSQEKRERIVIGAESYLGRPYNHVFYMKSDAIYCSELPYLVFNAEHEPLGQLQKIGELHVNNSVVHKLFEDRWRMHPLCQKPDMDFGTCWNTLMEEPIITPVSLAHDQRLVRIYSNYLF